MDVSQTPGVCREELGSLSPGRLVQIGTRTTLSPCSVKQSPFLGSPALIVYRSVVSAVYGAPSGFWSNLSKAALVHTGFLSWKKILSLALNNLCWH